MHIIVPTLYCALNNTRLEDFAIHIDRTIDLWAARVLNISAREMVHFRWERKQDPEHDNWVDSTGYAPDGTVRIQFMRWKASEINYFWWAWPPEDDTYGEGEPPGRFTIEATRYQQDRVEIQLFESDGTKVREQMLQWFIQHWENQIDIYEPDETVVSRVSTPPPAISDRGSETEYFAFFDWWYAQPLFLRSLEDAARIAHKSLSSIEKWHAAYQEAKRNEFGL